MVTFNVHHADGDDVFPFFVPRVEPLGTHGMLANRFRDIPTQSFVLKQSLGDLVAPEQFAVAIGMPTSEVLSRDAAFSKTIASELSAVLRETRQRRYQLAPEWKQGIRTFVAGGGAGLPVYRDGLEQCRPPGNCSLLRSQLLPTPSSTALLRRLRNTIVYRWPAVSRPTVSPWAELFLQVRLRMTAR